MGTGTSASAMNASVLVAQGTPRRLYMMGANSGKPAPNQDRTKVIAANAELAFIV